MLFVNALLKTVFLPASRSHISYPFFYQILMTPSRAVQLPAIGSSVKSRLFLSGVLNETACFFSAVLNVCVVHWTGIHTFYPHDVCSEQRHHLRPGIGFQWSCASRRSRGIATQRRYRYHQRAG